MSKQLAVADYLAKAIELSGKTQREIAEEVGFPKPNIITMMKQGLTKVPIDRAPALARALNIDPAHFMRLVMREYMPEAWRAIETTVGQSLTQNEQKLVNAYREACGQDEVEVDAAVVRALQGVLLDRG